MTDNTIHTALATANAELTNPGKDGHANYGAYTTLAGVLDHCRPVLAKHGLFITQDVSNDDTHLIVSTTIHHASGESITFGPLTWPMVDKIQTLGGLMTYTRRYSVMAALGLSGTDDDDDGQQANHDATRTQSGSTPNPRGLSGPAARNLTGPASDKQIGMLKGVMRDQRISEVILNDYAKDQLGFELDPVKGLNGLTKGQASALIEALTAVKGGIRVERPTAPDPDDPWATAPLIDPATGEQAR